MPDPMVTVSAHWSTWIRVLDALERTVDDDPNAGLALLILRDELRDTEGDLLDAAPDRFLAGG
jgi:hypothetical protein